MYCGFHGMVGRGLGRYLGKPTPLISLPECGVRPELADPHELGLALRELVGDEAAGPQGFHHGVKGGPHIPRLLEESSFRHLEIEFCNRDLGKGNILPEF